jgi:hypothetical protein
MQSLIGFTYRDLVLASTLNNILDICTDKVTINQDKFESILKPFGDVKSDVILNALMFIRSIGDTYALRSQIHRHLSLMLELPDYFPEQNINYVDGTLPEQHAELFQFWKDYNTHIKYRRALSELCSLIGIDGLEIDADPEKAKGCIYHRGMIIEDVNVLHVAELYHQFTSLLDFSVALPPPNLSFKDYSAFCFSVDDGKLNVYYPTLSGVIYFEGSTKVNNPFLDNHLLK